MNARASIPDDHPADPAADRAAWARGVTVRQVERLDKLAEAGLKLALTIEDEAAQAVAAGRPSPDNAAMAFSRVARAVRMTGLLQAKLIKDLEEADRREAAGKTRDDLVAETCQEQMRLDPQGYRQKVRVERIFERVAKAACGADEHRLDRLCVEAGERLDDEDLYGDVTQRPVGELVALLCRDLGLEPDWSRLAEEAWARAEGITPERPPSLAAANGAGGPLAGRSEERGAVGENHPATLATPGSRWQSHAHTDHYP